MPAITTYCSWADVTSRIGTDGADDRIDDDPTTQTDVLESASVEVNGYLQLLYTVAQLATSNWVRFKTRDIGVFLLCLRRNHPPPQSVQFMYDKAIKDLELVRDGKTSVPDIPKTKADVPVLSNQRVTLTPFPQVKTVTGKSTGTPEDYTQHTDTRDSSDYAN